MLGLEGACELLAQRLEQRMPAKVIEMLARYGLAATDLPAPGLYARQQRARIEPAEYPAIEVIGRDAGYPALLDRGDDVVTWAVPYVLRVFVSVRGNSFDEVDLRRKRLVLGAVEVLAADVRLQTAPQAWVDVNRLRQSFSEVAGTAGEGRSLAAAFVELVVMVEEMTASATPLGVADVIAVHPALVGTPAGAGGLLGSAGGYGGGYRGGDGGLY